EHLSRVPFYGAAVLCADDPGVRSILPRVPCPFVTYGFGRGRDWRATDLRTGPEGSSYRAWFRGRERGTVRLRTGGAHNALNSLCVLAAGAYLGLPFENLARGLAGFGGVKRRLDPHGETGGVKFYDDYGHHPTEIRNTLAAIRAIHRPRRLLVMFQPHRYSRTALLYRDFARELRAADKVYLLDVYPAGEKPLRGISSRLILGAAGRRSPLVPYPGVLEVAKDLRPGDLLLSLGAGDVWKSLDEVKSKFELIGG
ncbi:MAG TPA: cyanophycin synthetase, partial [Elusimicrobiales bacterium]|nr:cyanophycin synthetase [Elusimicrobiales bacterium]